MARLGCECGYVIPDHDYALDYKAFMILDNNFVDFSDWFIEEIQGYITAVQNGGARQWLLDNGYGEDYANLNLDHGNIMHDHILLRKFFELKKDVYECTQCGRLHVQGKNNAFFSYSPGSGSFNGALKSNKSD